MTGLYRAARVDKTTKPNNRISINIEYNDASPLTDSVHVEPNSNCRKMGLILEQSVSSSIAVIDPSMLDKSCTIEYNVPLALKALLLLSLLLHLSKSSFATSYRFDVWIRVVSTKDFIFFNVTNGSMPKQSFNLRIKMD